MKKWLVLALIVMFTLVVTGTTFAASLPDVPTTHWAYGSVTKLAKAGLINGYGDGTFKGDRPMTRYEFAVVTDKLIGNYESADEANKKLIDALSAEFASELNRMGVRVTKLEAKTNVWAGGETRLRYVADSPKNAGARSLNGSDRFQFRQRVKFWGNINDNYSWYARLTASGNAGNYDNQYSPADGTVAGFDIFAITAKNQLGFDKIRIGRFPLDSFGSGLIGKAVGVDGVRFDKKFGDFSFIGAIDNVKSAPVTEQGTAAAGRANTLSTVQVGYKFSDKLSWRAGYYMSNIPGTSNTGGTGTLNTNLGTAATSTVFTKSHGWATGFASKIGSLQFFGDYIGSTLSGATGGLPTGPKAWALELTNSTYCPPVFFSGVNLVDPAKKGTDAWMISYRSIDAGAIPSNAGGFDTMALAYNGNPYSIMKGTDNVNVIYLAYQNVVAKNIIASLEYQNFKIKNHAIATSAPTGSLDQTYMFKLEFFY